MFKQAKAYPFPVLFEDDDIIAVDKPENISTIPERDLTIPSIFSMVSAQFNGKLYVVHRLDKAVSGVVIFAKTSEAHKLLNLQFEQRRIQKEYRGVAWGTLAKKSGTIIFPIREYGSGRMGIDQSKGKKSITEYTVIRNHNDFSHLSIKPVTGRRHQIRVHLYAMGHPLVGDERYGDNILQSHFPRLLLHAYSIKFKCPKGKVIKLISDLPATFKETEENILPLFDSANKNKQNGN